MMSNNSSDLISVIMATYNTEREYLNMAINSILNQTYSNIEFIIICDGSVNEYNYLVGRYNDNRIKFVLHEKNKGLPYSLNEGIRLSSGKYIARMDSDDFSLPQRLEIQQRFMKENPKIEICGMAAKCFGDSKRRIRYFFTKPNEIEIQLLFSTVLIHPTVMFKREFFKKNMFYNENYFCAQDMELWTRVAHNIAVIKRYGLKYRIHNKQAGQSKREKQIFYASRILERNAKRIGFDFKQTYMILKTLNGILPIEDDNVCDLCKHINLIANNQNRYDKELMKKIFYNRLLILIIKTKKIKLLLKKCIIKEVLSFTNIKYLLWKIFN